LGQRFCFVFFSGASGRSPGAPETPRKEKYRLGKSCFRGAAPEIPRPGSAPERKKNAVLGDAEGGNVQNFVWNLL